MLHNIFTLGIETQAPDKLSSTNEALLSEAERACLWSFVARLGDLVKDDTSPFTSAERKRLTFLQWLYTNGKLPD